MVKQTGLRGSHVLTRPTGAHIDLDALRHNYRFARQLHGGRTLAVMKANAYGHGAVPCALAIQDMADGYAVAFMQEALELREHGIDQPILVMEGVFDEQEMQAAFDKQLAIVIHQQEQVDLLERHGNNHCVQARQPRERLSNPNVNEGDGFPDDPRLDVWLKVDTGMHRLGFHPEEVAAVHQRLRTHALARSVTLMTHFSRADETHCAHTVRQIDCFDEVAGTIPGGASLCNSAGITAWPSARRDWGRAGLMLYGADPTVTHQTELQPVMTLQSKIMAVRSVPAGEPIGYGAGYVTQRPTRIGVVAIGYGDGYPRHAPSGTPVLVDHQLTHLIGRVCMDMLMVDLTDLPDTGIGSDVELWGKTLNVCTIAHHAGTVAHALLTGVMRVRRCFSASAQIKANNPQRDLSFAP